jgi:hypothetical protein
LLLFGFEPSLARAQTTTSSSTTTAPQSPTLKIEAVDSPQPYFDIELAPGASKPLTVRLSNPGASSVAARTYVADASTTVNGGLTAKTWGTPKTGATTWVDYKDEELELQPGQAVTRTFQVTVPADASAGEYISSVAIENRDPVGTESSQALQRLRQVVAIQTTVPGVREPKLDIKGVDHDIVGKFSIVIFHLANEGNVRLAPAGTATVTDSSGKKVASAPLTMGSFYAHNEADLELPLAKILQPGKYRAKLVLKDSKTEASDEAELPFEVASTKEPTVRGSAPTLPSVDQSSEDSNKASGPSPLLAIPAVVVVVAATLLLRRRRSSGPATKADIAE